MLEIAHIALGALVGLVVCMVLFREKGRVLRYSLVFSIAGAVWALVPDLEKIFSSSTLKWLHESVWSDVFMLHHYLDSLDPFDSPLVSFKFILMLLPFYLFLLALLAFRKA